MHTVSTTNENRPNISSDPVYTRGEIIYTKGKPTQVSYNRLTQHGVLVEFTHASSVPGPGATGMATSDTRLWVRIDSGPWYRPVERSTLKFMDAIIKASSAAETKNLVESGYKQYS